MCFDIFYELNDFSANFRKGFVGAHRGVTRPYKSISAINDGSDDELDDGDLFSQLLHNTEAELLLGSTKGLANFKAVKKLVEENIYE